MICKVFQSYNLGIRWMAWYREEVGEGYSKKEAVIPAEIVKRIGK
jgi:hypothetical protein